MRFSLVILACLTTAFGSNLEEATNAPTSSLNVEDANDLDVGLDEDLETENFKDSKTMDEDKGTDSVDEDDDEGEDQEEKMNEPETNFAEDEITQKEEKIEGDENSIVESVQGNDSGDDAKTMISNNDVGDAVPPNPDEEKKNNDDTLSTNELDSGSDESESEAGDNQISGVEGNEGKGKDVLDNQEDKEDPSDENYDVQANEEKDNEVLSFQEEDEDPSDENLGVEGNNGDDKGIPDDQEEDEDKTIASSRTINPGLDDLAPNPTPIFSFTPYPTAHRSPTLRPAVPYVSTDDDPLEKGDDHVSNIEDWFSNESTIEEMEHDKSVIIALSIVFGVMFFFSIFAAYQMLENPDGCCASLCRITVVCWCALIRCICYPCRAMCGCTGPSGGQHMMVPDDGHFTHDLELS